MDPDFFLRGLIIGFSIAAAIGPISILCIHRTLTEGRTTGLVSGLGAATGDAIYGFIAGFGLTFISQVLIGQQQLIRLFGVAFLCYLGIKTFLSRPAAQGVMDKEKQLGFSYSYVSTFLLTITNPMTIILFTGVFAGMGVGSSVKDYGSAGLLVLGVFTGSMIWWVVLSGFVNTFRKRLNNVVMRWINRASGVVITGFGVYALLGIR